MKTEPSKEKFPLRSIDLDSPFTIHGVSYAGHPKDNTMMYITKKVEHLADGLIGYKECLIFLENGIQPDDTVIKNNKVVYTDNPQWEYAKCVEEFAKLIQKEEAKQGFSLTNEGYYIGKNVTIGENSYIEPGVLIGHNVSIGKNAKILSGSKIKNAKIGDDFLCNENAVVGDYSFTIVEDSKGNKKRIPALGQVIIGNDVEIGACNVISRGMCSDTILEDYVKLAELVHVGHESHLHKNVQLTAGVIVAGFVTIEENAYLGVNSCIRNRIQIGKDCVIGMGATVIKSVNDCITVVGNPAKSI